jgi:indole-3-glycerol phosphate synthase
MMDYSLYALEMAKTLKRLEAAIAVVADCHPNSPHVGNLIKRKDQHHAATAEAMNAIAPALDLDVGILLSADGK